MNTMSNVWKLYASRFFCGLIPAYVIEMLFFEQRGMTIQKLVFIEIFFALTVVLLEIPTGIIADKWGRKRMIMLNAFLGCCEFLILLFSYRFWHFAVVVILAGIGYSASSGAGNAMLYDSLLSSGKEQDFEKHIGRLNVIDFTAIIIASMSGSLLAGRFGFEMNYWLSVGSMLVAFVFTLTLREPVVHSEADEYIPINEYVKISIRFFRKNHGVCLVLLAGMITGATLNFLEEFWQIYLERLEVPVTYFGLCLSLFILLKLPGNMLASALRKRFGYRLLLSVVTAAFAVGFLYMSVFQGYSSLVVLVLIALFSGITEPLVSGYLHHRIEDSGMRATIDSFHSLGLRAAIVATGLGFGFVSARFDIFGGFGFTALVCVGFLIYFLTVAKKVIE